MFYVYILQCSDKSYYIGQTTQPETLVQQHATKRIYYTALRLPVTIMYTREFTDIAEATRFEIQIKGWSRAKKEALMVGDFEAIKMLSRKKFKPKENASITQ